MKSLSSVAVGLSVVFGCLLLALIAEFYYLFWWKKRIISKESSADGCKRSRKDFFCMCLWKKPLPRSQNLQESLCCSTSHVHESSPQAGQNQYANSNKDFWGNPVGEEEGIDNELMRLHHMAGPPRFLFTIKEETKEDLESEERSWKGSKSRTSLADLFHTVETPYSTPPVASQNQHGFNPFLESASDAEFNRVRASPPPTFKFLRDAEDKFHIKALMGEAQKSAYKNDEENGSFSIVVGGKNNKIEHGRHQNVLQYPSNSSKVLPLA